MVAREPKALARWCPMHTELRDHIDPSPSETPVPSCRFCAAPLRRTFVDLGMSPLCESYVPAERLGAMEPFYPLHVRVCERCLLVQLEEFVARRGDLHRVRLLLVVLRLVGGARARVRGDGDRALRARRRQPGGRDRQQRRLPAPARRRARHSGARASSRPRTSPRSRASKGIETIVEFFGRELAAQLVAAGRRADLLVANNVMAHVPDLNDFVGGMEPLLGAARRGHDRVPAPRCASSRTTSSTRSTTSTSRTSRS